MFSIRFDNLMADGFRFKCTIDDLPKCEIRINGAIVGTLKECNNSFANVHPDFRLSVCHPTNLSSSTVHLNGAGMSVLP